jgi:hypothetical protein
MAKTRGDLHRIIFLAPPQLHFSNLRRFVGAGKVSALRLSAFRDRDRRATGGAGPGPSGGARVV